MAHTHTCVLYVYTCIGMVLHVFICVYMYFLTYGYTHTPFTHMHVLTVEASVCGNADVDSGENDTQLCQPSSHEGFFRSEEPKGVCVCVCVSVLTISMPWLSSKISRKLCIEYKRLVINPHINSYWLMETTDTSG